MLGGRQVRRRQGRKPVKRRSRFGRDPPHADSFIQAHFPLSTPQPAVFEKFFTKSGSRRPASAPSAHLGSACPVFDQRLKTVCRPPVHDPSLLPSLAQSPYPRNSTPVELAGSIRHNLLKKADSGGNCPFSNTTREIVIDTGCVIVVCPIEQATLRTAISRSAACFVRFDPVWGDSPCCHPS
jgi:hypothetical protein